MTKIILLILLGIVVGAVGVWIWVVRALGGWGRAG